MVQRDPATGEQTLQFADLLQLDPPRAAITNSNAANYDGYYEEIISLHASPDNQLIAVYTYQFGTMFFDHNVNLYRMSDGMPLTGGFVNEHAFSGLDKSVIGSTVMDDCIAAERAFGVDEASLSTMDYRLDVDSGGHGYSPIIRWHDDTTISLTIEPEVIAGYDNDWGFSPVCQDTEAFTIYLNISDTTATRDRFAALEPEASYPFAYQLQASNSTGDFVRLSGDNIGFEHYFTWNGRTYYYYLQRPAEKVEGVIPRIFRIVWH